MHEIRYGKCVARVISQEKKITVGLKRTDGKAADWMEFEIENSEDSATLLMLLEHVRDIVREEAYKL